MMKQGFKNIVIITLLAVGSCIEPFDPTVLDNNQAFLVVDGVITDQQGPYTVKLSNSVPLKQVGDVGVQVKGALVTIEEENGVQEVLTETSAGIYKTINLQGIVGRNYRLIIQHNGQEYRSSWEKLNASPAIDSVYYRLETHGTTDIENDADGVQFYIDSQGAEGGSRWFRYEWEETWKIGTTYATDQIYLGDDKVDWAPVSTHTCWKFDNSDVINLSTTDGLSANKISKHQLPFITGEDERFSIRYSLLVKQFALNEDEYLFWKYLRESSEQLGSLFDKQPATVVGNIRNISSKDEVVLGYFSASGVKESRVFLKEISTLSRRAACNIGLIDVMKVDFGFEYESVIQSYLDQGKIFYRVIDVPPIGVVGVRLADPKCIDCTTKGGDLTEPDYWDE